MFQGVRANSTFYILNKADRPTLRVGQVVSVSNPMPKYQPSAPMVYPSNDMVVDISVKAGDETLDFKQLPAQSVIADFGSGVVVAGSREAMLAEVESMQRASRDILQSMDMHTGIVEACDEMIQRLNPQMAKEREQEKKIGLLEDKVCGMESTLADIKSMLAGALSNKPKN